MNEEIEADTRPDDDLIDAYLTGALSEAQAENFEARYFADDRLALELERTLELRAALQTNEQPRRPIFTLKPRERHWALSRPVMAAAAVAVAAVGITLLLPTKIEEPAAPLMRGIAAGLPLELQRSDHTLAVTWPAVTATSVYQVQLFNASGELLVEKQTNVNHTNLSREPIDALPESMELFVRVQALDDLQQVLLSSELTRVPE